MQDIECWGEKVGKLIEEEVRKSPEFALSYNDFTSFDKSEENTEEN